MLNLKRKNRIVVKAFSLLEMLIALSLTSFIIISILPNMLHYFSNKTTLSEKRFLQLEAFQIMNYIEQHLSYINYVGKLSPNTNYHLFMQDKQNYRIGNNWFMIMYDANHNGCISFEDSNKCIKNGLNDTTDFAKEILGLKIENNRLFRYVVASNKYKKCSASECKKVFEVENSSLNTWEEIDTKDSFKIHSFQLKWKEPNKILSVQLKLNALKKPDITYEATRYIYILNQE